MGIIQLPRLFAQMATKRVHGQLSDWTNASLEGAATPVRPKRACADKANSRIKQHNFRHGSKGLCLHRASSTTSPESPDLSPNPSPESTNPSTNFSPDHSPDHPPDDHTLNQLLKDRPQVIHIAQEKMKHYFERHTTFEVQKKVFLVIVSPFSYMFVLVKV